MVLGGRPWTACLGAVGLCRGPRSVGREFGRPLVVERREALPGLVRVDEQAEPAEGELAEPRMVLAVGVERLLEEAQRGGREGEDLVRPAPHLRTELARRDDLVDEPPALGGLGVVAAAKEPVLTRPLLADHAGEVGGPEPGVE